MFGLLQFNLLDYQIIAFYLIFRPKLGEPRPNVLVDILLGGEHDDAEREDNLLGIGISLYEQQIISVMVIKSKCENFIGN